MRTWLAGLAIGVAALAPACTPPVYTSAVATAPAAGASVAPVRITAMIVPERAIQLGIVQSHSDQTDITQIMPALVTQVAQLGGDMLKVDDVTTTYSMQTRTRSESYSCGSTKSPSTCSRTVTETVEVPTTRILGRALKTVP
jgi:hypothetical protein